MIHQCFLLNSREPNTESATIFGFVLKLSSHLSRKVRITSSLFTYCITGVEIRNHSRNDSLTKTNKNGWEMTHKELLQFFAAKLLLENSFSPEFTHLRSYWKNLKFDQSRKRTKTDSRQYFDACVQAAYNSTILLIRCHDGNEMILHHQLPP